MITTVKALKDAMESGSQTLEISGELYSDVKKVRDVNKWKFSLAASALTAVIVAAAPAAVFAPIGGPAWVLAAGAAGAALAVMLGISSANATIKVAVGLGSMELLTKLRAAKKVSDSHGTLVLDMGSQK
jgi:hypothetical protein